MAIYWTPWNASLKRRLEVVSAAIAMFMPLICGPICSILMCYVLVMFELYFNSKQKHKYNSFRHR